LTPITFLERVQIVIAIGSSPSEKRGRIVPPSADSPEEALVSEAPGERASFLLDT
jgi:hypothetical protein